MYRLRFGTVAAIGAEGDPQRVEEVGEAIVRCATGGELRRIDRR